MKINIVYNEKTSDLASTIIAYLCKFHPDIEIESYDEDYSKDRKKAFKIKGACSARMTPFVSIYNKRELIKAFYSEAKECTFDNIKNYLDELGKIC